MIIQASRKKNQVISLRNEQVILTLVQEYESVRKCRFATNLRVNLWVVESCESVKMLGEGVYL
ncbi:hypothetical protein Hanom_Chr07g00652341 [Helianthus anomalus]